MTFLNERGVQSQDDKLVNIFDDDTSPEMIGSSPLEAGRLSTSADVKTNMTSQGVAVYDPLKELQDLFSHEPVPTPDPYPAFSKHNLAELLEKNQPFTQFGDSETKNIENLLSSINVGGSVGQIQNIKHTNSQDILKSNFRIFALDN